MAHSWFFCLRCSLHLPSRPHRLVASGAQSFVVLPVPPHGGPSCRDRGEHLRAPVRRIACCQASRLLGQPESRRPTRSSSTKEFEAAALIASLMTSLWCWISAWPASKLTKNAGVASTDMVCGFTCPLQAPAERRTHQYCSNHIPTPESSSTHPCEI